MGAWQADVPHGLGRYHLSRGGIFAGQYCEGVKDGWGINTAASGMQFVGEPMLSTVPDTQWCCMRHEA